MDRVDASTALAEIAALIRAQTEQSARDTGAIAELLRPVAAGLSGPVDDIVFAGTVTTNASGFWTNSWAAAFGRVFVQGPAAVAGVLESSALRLDAAPLDGPGVINLGTLAIGADLPLVGRVLTLYAPAGTRVYLCLRRK